MNHANANANFLRRVIPGADNLTTSDPALYQRGCTSAGVFVIACFISIQAYGQSSIESQLDSGRDRDGIQVGHDTTQIPVAIERPTREALLAQIGKLSSTSYRAREMAMWQIRRNPQEAISLIREQLASVDFHASVSMIELLSSIATAADGALGLEAQKVLQLTAESGTTAVATLAKGSLQSIANLQEVRATELLIHLGMTIGFPELLVNGARLNVPQSSPVYAAWVNREFTGTAEDMLRMQFLQRVTLVYLQDVTVTDDLMRAVCQMPNVKHLVLREVKVAPPVLLLMSQMRNFEHFELSYVDIGDESLEILESLPVWNSMRLFGTKLSRAGADRLKERYSGLSFYFGKGGYLGVATTPLNSTVVDSVQSGSGADQAGIRAGDRLTHVGNNPIKSFEELRAELSYFGAGETVEIGFLRDGAQGRVSVKLTAMPASTQ